MADTPSLETVLALAERATPGRWSTPDQREVTVPYTRGPFSSRIICEVNRHFKNHHNDAEYIAALSPDVLAPLLRELHELRQQTVQLRDSLEEATKDAETWKGHAVALGVHGKAFRDDARQVLCLTMRVDAGVLHYGGAKVLDSTFRDMRKQYEATIPVDQNEEMARALNHSLADIERAKRRRPSSPTDAESR